MARPSPVPVQRPSRRGELLLLGGALLVALAVRVGLALGNSGLTMDSPLYVRMAEDVLAGRLGPSPAHHGYPLLVALAALVVPGRELPGRVVSCVASLALVAEVWAVARRRSPPRNALVPALIVALHPLLAVYGTATMTEATFLALAFGGVALLDAARPFSGGVLLGAAWWVRPEAAVVAPLAVLFAPLTARRPMLALLAAALVALSYGALLRVEQGHWSLSPKTALVRAPYAGGRAAEWRLADQPAFPARGAPRPPDGARRPRDPARLPGAPRRALPPGPRGVAARAARVLDGGARPPRRSRSLARLRAAAARLPAAFRAGRSPLLPARAPGARGAVRLRRGAPHALAARRVHALGRRRARGAGAPLDRADGSPRPRVRRRPHARDARRGHLARGALGRGRGDHGPQELRAVFCQSPPRPAPRRAARHAARLRPRERCHAPRRRGVRRPLAPPAARAAPRRAGPGARAARAAGVRAPAGPGRGRGGAGGGALIPPDGAAGARTHPYGRVDPPFGRVPRSGPRYLAPTASRAGSG